MVKIEIRSGSGDISDAREIRRQVFVLGQNVPANLDDDGLDAEAMHALVYLDSEPVGTARIRFNDGKARLERIAILESQRGKKLGIQLMEYLIKYCKEEKVTEIYMHAQYYLLNYYSRFGFKERGEIFEEAGIKHVEMYKEI